MQASLYSSRKQDDSEFNLTEFALKARISRRYSTSYIRNIREDITTTRSFRSNTTISSTASSPGYSFKVSDEIDPSTYSFNTALKALKTRYHRSSWEWLTPDGGGFALNSKWSEAEKYICNPISGEVPLECLSAKSLSRRSFRKSSSSTTTNSGVTLSAISSRHTQTKHEEQDVNPDEDGTQITPPYLSTSNGSTSLTSSIPERSTKLYNEDSPNSTAIAKSKEQVEMQGKETWDTTKESEREKNEYIKKDVLCRQSGCFSWMRHNKRHKENHERQRRNNTSFLHFKVC
ncbi:hypothetical protein PIB30_053289 [Stylosanthes scabra]|uniref:Uncharacterized protein n=1 Tax=Stylosanthes scabra TaxID=79078 RepID=A0ABU6UHX0_9FABA|nr:hypothetical protein [Stylosanthes scabra]